MSTPDAARNAPEERVHQFMTDFEAQWQKAAPAFRDRTAGRSREAFALWRELMAETASRQYLDPSSRLGGSFSDPPDHGPQAETFIGSEIHGDVAYVRTRETSLLKRIYEYTLRERDGDWRIEAIQVHDDDPTQPFVEPVTVQERRRLTSREAQFAPMPPEQAGLDEVRNFTEREVSGLEKDRSTPVQVPEVGTLVTTSGVLTVLDFGDDNDSAHPLAVTVEPGSYPVDRVTAAGRNAAVRVRFSENAPVSWHPAAIPGSGHVIGVDAGSACLMDFVAYAAVPRREKADAFQRFSAAERPAAIEVRLGGADVGIAVASGYGDGSYPVYWGVDAEGRVAQLVVDFMVLAAQDDTGALTHR